MSNPSPAFSRILELVKPTRLRPSSKGARDIMTESESDKGRVINSAAFRRLQQKAQVFPLDTNAAVRTRLTHSIEVSQIGRYLAQRVIAKLGSSNSHSFEELSAFVNTVESACLLHDIGNPPFGHLGEAAIRNWFLKRDSDNSPTSDVIEFDGNPQGFRLISFLSGSDEFGMNLTCTLLLSTIKYPWKREAKGVNNKIGLFDMEHATYEEACNTLTWEPGQKFPFVRLMEAADDIAYSMSDLEDGLEKGIISEQDIQDAFGKETFPESKSINRFVNFKTNVINQAVEQAASKFVEHLDDILNGVDSALLDPRSEPGVLMRKVNQYAQDHIYSHESAESIELAGRSVISGLLDHFQPLLELDEDSFRELMRGDKNAVKKKRLDFQIRLLRRLPTSYREKYNQVERGQEHERRQHLITDFISGMTDHFALETYQILEGIRIT